MPGQHKKARKRAVLAQGQVVAGMSKCPALQGVSKHPQQVMGAGSHDQWKKRDILVIGFISFIASVALPVFHNILRVMSKAEMCGRVNEI